MKSNYIPKVLGVVLLVAGLAYTLDSFAHFLLANYAHYKTFFLIMAAVLGILGELSLCFWLLIRGGKVQQARVLQPAQV
jgi:hypothetical protein